MDVHDKLIHDGKKEMKCEFCDKTFRIAVSLKYHIRTGKFLEIIFMYIDYRVYHLIVLTK